jgi:hypothetical protein
MELIELRSALLGASSVLLALPLSEAAISQQWSWGTTIVSGLGLIALAAGLAVSLTLMIDRADKALAAEEGRKAHG